MVILITVDPEIPVPPKLYGGIERIVDGLITAYTQKGHAVFLLANGASTTKKAAGIIAWKGKSSRGKLNILTNTLQLYKVCRQIKPDAIHSFSRLWYLLLVFLFTKIPIIQSFQREISNRTTKLAKLLAGRKLQLTACARHMFQSLEQKKNWKAIYNFTDTSFFIPKENPNLQHLFFLGRIEAIKGVEEAIQVAKAVQIPLIIAGNIPEEHQDYFEADIKPNLADPLINYVGPVNDEQKKLLFQSAIALVFPIKWEEPFGIVMAESMACGAPVIAFNRGSVEEVVVDGVNGYKVGNLEEMILAVKKINTIDRKKVRQDAVERFSIEVIADEYLNLYR
jgi:glycosyltransferase involved in cell wall biosynthesis